jgi:hypothetical protein
MVDHSVERLRAQLAEAQRERDSIKCEIEMWRDGNIIREETLEELKQWREVAGRLARYVRIVCVPTDETDQLLRDFDTLNKSHFDAPQLPSFTSEKINPESKQ